MSGTDTTETAAETITEGGVDTAGLIRRLHDLTEVYTALADDKGCRPAVGGALRMAAGDIRRVIGESAQPAKGATP